MLDRRKMVNDTLANFDDRQVRKCIVDMWIDGHSKRRTSIDNCIDERTMYNRIDKCLRVSLQDFFTE